MLYIVLFILLFLLSFFLFLASGMPGLAGKLYFSLSAIAQLRRKNNNQVVFQEKGYMKDLIILAFNIPNLGYIVGL